MKEKNEGEEEEEEEEEEGGEKGKGGCENKSIFLSYAGCS